MKRRVFLALLILALLVLALARTLVDAVVFAAALPSRRARRPHPERS
jgi:hypothetical protein